MPKITSPDSCNVMLTVSETAERLNVCERTVRRLIAEGKIRIYQIRRSIRISEADLLDYLKTIRK